jgi:hypothetical protein
MEIEPDRERLAQTPKGGAATGVKFEEAVKRY